MESAAKEELILKNRELVLAFDRSVEYEDKFVNVTPNGEICWMDSTREFVVLDESYSDEVCRTNYPLVALAALVAYCEEYLV